jgi:uncharacterized OB-fold protein
LKTVDRNLQIIAWFCRNGHRWLYGHNNCPDCGEPLAETLIASDARLISHTVVRVNPTGRPIRLGVAETASGATTLCIITGRIRGNGRDHVRLVLRDGRYHALASGSRLENSRTTGNRG